ncbi:UDP-N-acetylmuramoyl-tripeptide--D-alanyl-D-alanine ligase [Prevotella sp. E13-27]|uniref:UDP-N-acetylmuramoyl-tripeptide--D-alanyl-D- alanine ligase n=1 Tax=Prevotella sp. E13-27 TaxID=2938122 RepID=UPI00200B7ADE|nr:UDP-N-acetylmuramoyl-tripeptide--D-alanyl-D-alanine ligase [Prevotella sp. E13-27]MCK8621858.1 UDP-N-acetylmuramoyl-tripeptide--D-alanyl-D-alanine ligase [Prevotella sp. E13-27]
MTIKELYQLYQQHPCITTDSRDCPKGSIFLALKGASFNGNDYALQALEKGCSYAIVDTPTCPPEGGEWPNGYQVYDLRNNVSDKNYPSSASDDSSLIRKELPSLGEAGGGLILVDDCLQTYKDLAREHRRQFNIPVIAITGTNGKTTTKELIRAVLSEKYNVLATEGNFNNDVGVPKTLFRLNSSHEIAIIEMGASHPGDIKTLAETAEPTCGLITNVGRAHLQGFGSFEGVVKTKCELYDFLRTQKDGHIFLDADNDNLVDQLEDEDSLWVTPYSTDPEKQYTCISGEVVACDPLLKFRWRKPVMELEEEGASQKWHKVQTHLIGAYNIDNLLAAIAVGINFGVDRKAICHALENYEPTNKRSQLMETAHNRLIVDAYNANPSSMEAALENFRLVEAQRKMVILGDMRELGPTSHEEHQHIVDLIANTGVDTVWLVGEEFGSTTCPASYRKFTDVEQVKAAIAAEQPSGNTILIKGSNGTRLYQLPELL